MEEKDSWFDSTFWIFIIIMVALIARFASVDKKLSSMDTKLDTIITQKSK